MLRPAELRVPRRLLRTLRQGRTLASAVAEPTRRGPWSFDAAEHERRLRPGADALSSAANAGEGS